MYISYMSLSRARLLNTILHLLQRCEPALAALQDIVRSGHGGPDILWMFCEILQQLIRESYSCASQFHADLIGPCQLLQKWYHHCFRALFIREGGKNFS